MENLQRHTQKIFGGNAPADDIAALGSFKSGTPIYTDDISALQNEAYEKGYGASLVADEAPFLEEQNSVPYVLSSQLAYLCQKGIPEWDANTTYYANTSFCQINGIIYQSLTDGNLGNNPATDSENWGKWGGSNEDLYSYITNAILLMPENAISFEGLVATVKAGIRVLIPNGRNADGTLKNIDYTVTEDITHTESTGSRYLFLSATEGIFSVLTSHTFIGKDADKPLIVSTNNSFLYYATDTNILYKTPGSTTANWTPFPCVAIAEFVGNTNSVSNLKIFEPVELAKKKDLEPLLNKTQISNCILEIPERIKYEITSDGQIILKAGSEVFVSGNGTFESVVLSSDTLPKANELWTADASRQLFVVYVPETNAVHSVALNNTYGQTTAPTTFLAGFALWYNPDTNVMKITRDSGETWEVCSLPLMIGRPQSQTGAGWRGYVDTVFNGMGFFGQYTFTLPGLKCLFADGRNPDGTLKNIEVTQSAITLNNLSNQASILGRLIYSSQTGEIKCSGYGRPNYFVSETEPTLSDAVNWYDTKSNLMKTKTANTDWEVFRAIVFPKLTKTNGTANITNISLVNTVSIATRADIHDAPPDLSRAETKSFNTNYTAQEDGWLQSNSRLRASCSIQVGNPSNINVATVIDELVVYNNRAQCTWDGSGNTVQVVTESANLVRVYRGQTYKMYQTEVLNSGVILSTNLKFFPLKK